MQQARRKQVSVGFTFLALGWTLGTAGPVACAKEIFERNGAEDVGVAREDELEAKRR